MIVHFGHSCLSAFGRVPCPKFHADPAVPVNQTSIKTLYVFVEIAIDTPHLALSVRRNFPSEREAFERVVLQAKAAAPGGKVPIQLEADDEQRRDGQGQPAGIGAADVENPSRDEKPITRLALVSTIQFVAAIQALKEALSTALPPLSQEDGEQGDQAVTKVQRKDVGVWRGRYDVTIPQARPLSPGEVLGCTAPKLNDVDALM